MPEHLCLVHVDVRALTGSQPHPRTRSSAYRHRCAAWSANKQLADQRDQSILKLEKGNELIEAFDKNSFCLSVIDVFSYAYWNESTLNRLFLCSHVFRHPVPVIELFVINTFLCAIILLSHSGRLPAVNMPQHSFTTFMIDRYTFF